jgi:hypothetical protein
MYISYTLRRISFLVQSELPTSGVLGRSPGQAPTSKRCTSAEKFSPAAAQSPRPSSVARQPSCSRPGDRYRWDRWDGGSVLAVKDLGNIGKIGDVPI